MHTTLAQADLTLIVMITMRTFTAWAVLPGPCTSASISQTEVLGHQSGTVNFEFRVFNQYAVRTGILPNK